MWTNKYISIPYAKGGLDETGVDCWGLARMIYQDRLGIGLPAFADAATSTRQTMADEIAAHREQWTKVDEPKEHDLVLLRVDGLDVHIGVVAGPGQMIHALDGAGVVVERYDSARWRNRVSGFFRYSGGMIELSGCPHPLRTTRISTVAPAGATLEWIIHKGMADAGWTRPDKVRGMAWVDGQPIPRDQWGDYRPAPGAIVEFRIVPGSGDIGRTLGTILVMIAAIAVSVWVPTLLPGTATFLGMGGAFWGGVAGGLVGIVGGLLVNAIFPVRPPSIPAAKNPGSPEAQALLRSASNQANPYGAFPVCLGRMRYNGVLAANTYAEADATTSFIRMALLWGYGPLQITDMRVGDAKISTLSDCEIETVPGEVGQSMTRFNSLYGKDVTQEQVGIDLVNIGGEEINWVTTVISQDVDRITITLHFPEGLRKIKTGPTPGIGTDSTVGNIYESWFQGDIQVRQLDSATLAPITDWGDVHRKSIAETITLHPAYYQLDSDAELEPVYQWTRISLDEYCKVIIREGSVTTSPDADPSGALLRRLQADSYGITDIFSRLPDYGPGEEPLWDVCVYGGTIHEIVDRRTVDVTGCALTNAGIVLSLAAGTVARADKQTVWLGGREQLYQKRKDAFTHNVHFKVARGAYEIRARRVSASDRDYFHTGGAPGVNYCRCIFLAATGYADARPITPPKPMAMTALRVRATDQINGTLEAVSATCTSICLDYDRVSGTWILRPTRNPASLYRYVLQHPANAKRVTDDKIDIAALQVWHDYCRVNGFMFDSIMSAQDPLLDVLRDICAAGRSSPVMVDGKWSVVTDKPRTSIAQYITPHNSWGFEGVRALPKIPHAFRVTFLNSLRGYQEDELIVYADGYSAANATLIEGLSLPGVTTPTAIYKHARFHFAQLKLRPETYTVNMDIEHLICTRGDLVRVTHDVPMWGTGTGRIKNYISGTVLELDEPLPMDGGTQYAIRIRLADGSSVTRTVAAKGADGYYTEITLTASVTSTQGAPGNLCMFGNLASESVECIVHAIEPMGNATARLTLVDYSPDVYNSDTETIPAWDSQITLPPNITTRPISVRPTISSFLSDEGAMFWIGPGQWGYSIIVGYTNPRNVPKEIDGVEVQMDYEGDGIGDWNFSKVVPVGAGAATFEDVQEAEAYKFRARYTAKDGRTGPWSTVASHTVVGKLAKPGTPTGLGAEPEGLRIRLSWATNPEIDIARYEVRATNADWGQSGFLYRGPNVSCLVNAPAYQGSQTWYVKAIDTGNRYSVSPASISYTYSTIPAVSAISHSFADTSLTDATITLDWTDAPTPAFGLKDYRVSYGSVVKWTKASTITLPANWLGVRDFSVQVRDRRGNLGTARTKSVTKVAPNPVTDLRAQVIDNNVLLYWALPTKTTLPVQDVVIKRGAEWSGATLIGYKNGTFTTIQENKSGNYTYWVSARDTENVLSEPVAIATRVAEPPDFVFYASQEAQLDGLFSNAALDVTGHVVLPVNTAETWSEHFTENSWSTPQDQIDAGYPIYAQPPAASGYYQEEFDCGATIPSSKITVSLDTYTVGASPLPTLTVQISTSPDNSTWTAHAAGTDVFVTSFRYIRVRITATTTTGVALYVIRGFTVDVQAKQKSDSGSITANSADTTGTSVDFNKPFVDIVSLTATPGGTAARHVVIDFVDAPNPTGFKVYLYNTSGTRVSGTIYWQARGY